MKKQLVHILIAPALLLACNFAKAQANDDFMIWSGYSVTKNFDKQWSARFRQEIRLRENATQVQKVFTDLGVRYKLNNRFRFALHYRYSHNVRRDFNFSSRHRMNFDVIYREKFRWDETKNIVFNYRLRYQQNYRDVFSSETGFSTVQFLRHKFQGHLDIKNSRWSPYLATEFFHTVDEFPVTFVQGRYSLGTAYQLNRNNNITFYYMLRTKQNIKVPSTDYILGLRLNVFI